MPSSDREERRHQCLHPCRRSWFPVLATALLRGDVALPPTASRRPQRPRSSSALQQRGVAASETVHGVFDNDGSKETLAMIATQPPPGCDNWEMLLLASSTTTHISTFKLTNPTINRNWRRKTLLHILVPLRWKNARPLRAAMQRRKTGNNAATIRPTFQCGLHQSQALGLSSHPVPITFLVHFMVTLLPCSVQ